MRPRPRGRKLHCPYGQDEPLPWRSMVQTTSYMCWTMSPTRSRCFRSIRPAARWRLSPEAPSRCFRAQATRVLGQTLSPYSTEGDERDIDRCPERPEPELAGFGQAATPALGFIPDLLDEALVALDAELDDDIHQQVEQALDVVPGELAPSVALFHEQHQLFERQLPASGVDAGDGSGMTGVHIAQVVEGFLRAQLGEQNPVRLHAKTALQELLRRHAREPLIVLGVKETDVIRVGVENEFLGVLDRSEE